jgi:hypothetical protein
MPILGAGCRCQESATMQAGTLCLQDRLGPTEPQRLVSPVRDVDRPVAQSAARQRHASITATGPAACTAGRRARRQPAASAAHTRGKPA